MKPKRPQYEIEFDVAIEKLNGETGGSDELVRRPTRWSNLDDAALIAIECHLHNLDAELIRMGAQKALNTVEWDENDPADKFKKSYLQHVAEYGPVLPTDFAELTALPAPEDTEEEEYL